MSQPETQTTMQASENNQTIPQHPDSPIQHFDTPKGLALSVDFAWTSFRNTVSEKNGSSVTPLYIQHFRPSKPQLRFESAADKTNIASSIIHTFSIASEITLHSKTITLQPVKRLKTQYNYLSTTLSPDPNTPSAITWITNSSLKIWDFVCLDANQLPIAKFSVNFWALTQVGNFHFEKSREAVTTAARDEIVVVGLTLMYLMTSRMNSPLHLLGAAFAKPGKVGAAEGVEPDVRKDR
jgi:hypothetical protein